MSVRAPKFLLALFTAIILLVVSALQMVYLSDSRRRAVAAAEARSRNLVYAVSTYVRDNFGLADTSLRTGPVIHARRVGGATATSNDWDPILAAAKASLAGSGSISPSWTPPAS